MMVSVLEFQLGPQRPLNQYQWRLITTQFISVYLCVFVWRSHCLNCSASPLLTPSKWQNLFLFSLWANASVDPSPLCSIPSFGADILTHHWSSHQTNGNLPACWNYWWLSLSPPPPPTHHQRHTWLTPSLQRLLLCCSVSFSHPPATSLPSDYSLFSNRGGWGFTLFLRSHFIFVFPHIPTTQKVICLCLLKQAVWIFCAHVDRMTPFVSALCDVQSRLGIWTNDN